MDGIAQMIGPSFVIPTEKTDTNAATTFTMERLHMGGGMNRQIGPGGSFDDFLEFAESDDVQVEGLYTIKRIFNLL
jgi:hypothetical protein